MKEEFKELFEYNYHFNEKLIKIISENTQSVSAKIFKLLNHLINAQQIWNARIKNEKEFEVWQINNWNIIENINKENYSKTLNIINEIDIDNIIEYTNSKEIKFSNKIKDILFHIINHSTYHRAQIATELKICGIEPINTDYIFYKRKLE
ncbi:DinB family protein [Flavobacterium sp. GP15]|uniref:DinB family protein n=1 Tax=Flavobacterium sp. GP15 TaxID=2758567 RepID=UPI00165E6878|nr:DinB family protein [Flavobacterium sp. GP15]